MMKLVQLRPERRTTPSDLSRLQGYLQQLVGEPFRLARVSYGDELTLHFGDLRPAKSTKLKNHMYGEYVLGMRGSPWLLKAGSEASLVSAGFDTNTISNSGGVSFRKELLESRPLIQPESRALAVIPFTVTQANGIGLHMRVSDGSTLIVIPSPSTIEDPADAELPEVADWELNSPNGLLSVGPGPTWSFEPIVK